MSKVSVSEILSYYLRLLFSCYCCFKSCIGRCLPLIHKYTQLPVQFYIDNQRNSVPDIIILTAFYTTVPHFQIPDKWHRR